MSDLLAPSNTVTFTVTRMPRREAERKTLQRLMRMQPEIRKGLKALQLRRKRSDSVTYRRAGRDWTNRPRATRLTRVERGASFTLRLTPQILPDVRSVEKYLDMKAG
jgi:hypothetical protein